MNILSYFLARHRFFNICFTSANYIFNAVKFRHRIIMYVYKYEGKYTYSVSDCVFKCVHMRRFQSMWAAYDFGFSVPI